MKSHAVVAALAALAQESRLAVYRLLVKRGPNGFTPGELAQKLDIPAPTLSFHLKELQRAELVSSRREGRFLYYSANYQQMNELLAFLTENCCILAESTCASSCASSEKPKVKRA